MNERKKMDELQQQRRSANYKPNIWDHDFVQSLSSEYWKDTYKEGVQMLKENLRETFEDKDLKPLSQLELIYDLQRLGVGYLFDKEIKRFLDTVSSIHISEVGTSLYATALRFNLLRQHGYYVNQDVFKSFMDENGSFMVSISKDTKGMLHLYEASHLALEGEAFLDEAQTFTRRNLMNLRTKVEFGDDLAEQVARALETPLHRRVKWSEARWYISECERRGQINKNLLQLAKLNFNMVQAIHQEDLKEVSRWWTNLGLAQTLKFARDRLVESFLWTVGVSFRPQHGFLRKSLTKVICLIMLLDDVYDIYGSLDELEQFSDAVNRWDEMEIKHLPDYMKSCFLALYNTTNEIACEIEKQQKVNIIAYLKKAWADFCAALLLEARWYNMRYSPSLQEYLNNAWVSSSGGVLLVHSLFATSDEVSEEAKEFLKKSPSLPYCSSMIIRLCNDLATSKEELERGDVPSSIRCYMLEANVSEAVACEHITGMVIKTWKQMNRECTSQVPHQHKTFLDITLNIARVAHLIYQYGDGIGIQDRETRNHVKSLLIEPI